MGISQYCSLWIRAGQVGENSHVAGMSLSRRRFLLLTAFSALWASFSRLFAATPKRSDELSDRLSGWVDTLFPRDGDSPAASELRVHQQIIERAAGIPQYHQLLEVGMRWADAQAVLQGAATFAALDDAGRESVVAQAETMGTKAMPGLFFHHTLKDARQFYYEDAASWAGVGFPHAPQPYGYVNYMEAPK